MFPITKDEWKNNIALLDEYGHRATYGDLCSNTEKFSAFIKPRAVAIILCDYDIETISTYYSFMQLGVVPILLDLKAADEYIQRLCALYHPHYIWGQKEKITSISENQSGSIILESGGHVLYETTWDLYELNRELAILLTTSGSTGSPKMVRLSYGNLEYDVTGKWGITEKDRVLTLLPMFYCYGLSVVNTVLSSGGSIFLNQRSVIDPLLPSIINKYQITFMTFVPYSLTLLSHIDLKFDDWRSIRLSGVGGGAVTEEQKKFCDEYLKKTDSLLTFGYGQTEGTCTLADFYTRECPCNGMIGYARDKMEAFLNSVDDEGCGELIFKGPLVCLGYAYDLSDLAKGDENNRTLYTGDLAYIAEDGAIYLKGRIKRIVKILGKRISLEDIENLLSKKHVDNMFACVGENDAVKVCVKGDISEDEIKDFLFNEIGIYKNMITVVKMNEIPRTESGKIEYSKL